MEWQPIETAPKDGTKILGYDPSIIYPEERMAVMDFSIIGWAACVGEGDYERYSPTHWMPIPEAPNAEITGG